MTDKSRGGITADYTNFLRQKAQLTCPYCDTKIPDTEDRIKSHLEQAHSEYLESTPLSKAIQECRARGRTGPTKGGPRGIQSGQTRRPTGEDDDDRLPRGQPPGDTTGEERSRKPSKTPDHTAKPAGRAASSSPISRSRTRTPQDLNFRRPPTQGKKLWSPDQPTTGTQPSTRLKPVHKGDKRAEAPSRSQQQQHQYEQDHDEFPVQEEQTTSLIKQPETRPISQDQLVAEVKGIYAGLVMVENKCIEVDNAQNSHNQGKLSNEQWQALIALHRTLLHEHHDFFLASQHPSANHALQRLASKYAMPARMWRHGIHSFLELLRHRLPASLEHMLTFIYLAYSMMALLYETVPAFEDTWIECLGDLGRYRMAIEDDDIRDREVWTSVSRHWYSKASDKAPTTGRLYHHLAILARPNALQQLFYYTKSLCVPIPFTSARESIMTLFDPILKSNQPSKLSPIDIAYVKAHGILFSGNRKDEFQPAVDDFVDQLDNHIGRTTRRWMESGYYVGISTCCALLSYGKEENAIFKKIRPQRTDEPADIDSGEDKEMPETFKKALYLAEGTYNVVFRRFADPNVLPYFHTVLVFMNHLSHYPSVMTFVEATFPWKLVSLLLNSLVLSSQDHERILSDKFPRPEKESPRPLPEDFAMKGLLWAEKYFPLDWFSNEKIDDDEKYFEVASMTDERKARIIWIAYQLASHNKWLTYDKEKRQFGVLPEFEKEVGSIATDLDLNDIEMANMDTASDTTSQTSATMTPKNLEPNDQFMMDIDTSSQAKLVVQD